MSAWRRRAEEALRPRLAAGETLEVVARAVRFGSMWRGEGRRPAAIGGGIGFAVGAVPVFIAGAPWITCAVVGIAFGLMGAASAFEFANRRSLVVLTDRRLLVVPRSGRPEESFEEGRMGALANVRTETQGDVVVLTLPGSRRWVLPPTTPEDAAAASSLLDSLRSFPPA